MAIRVVRLRGLAPSHFMHTPPAQGSARRLCREVRCCRKQLHYYVKYTCLLARCILTRWAPTYRLSSGCSLHNFLSGQIFPLSLPPPLVQATHSIGLAMTWSSDLPRIPSAVGQVDKEQKWLPRTCSALTAQHPDSTCERKT